MADRVDFEDYYEDEEAELLAATSLFDDAADEWTPPSDTGTAAPAPTADMLLAEIESPEMRDRLRAIFANPDLARAATQLRQMLGSEDAFGENFSVMQLLTMLGSASATERQDGQRLLDMLNDPAQAAFARRLLSSFGMTDAERHQMLEMLNDPAQREAANQIVALLNSENGAENQAGGNVLRLLSSTDANARADGRKLLSMLSNADTRAAAMTIASTLDSPGLVRQMLALLNSPDNRGAARHILEMLGSQQHQYAGTNLLEMLASRFEQDRRDGQQIVSSLNDPRLENLGRALASVYDAEHRHILTEMTRTPDGREAASAILAMQSSPERRVRQAAGRMLEWLESQQPADRAPANRLVALLARPEHRATVQQMLIRLDDVQLTQMSELLTRNPDSAGVRELTRLLGGTPQDRELVYRLLDLRAGRIPGENPEGKKPSAIDRPDTAAQRQMADRILQMLGDPAQRELAQTLLRRVEHPKGLGAMLSLLGDASQRQATDHILRMLNSDNPQLRRGANTLLQMLATEPRRDGRPPGRNQGENPTAVIADRRGLIGADTNGSALVETQEQRDARRIIAMLNNPDQRQQDLAQQILAHLDTPAQIRSMLELQDRDPRSASQILEMLRNPAQTENAKKILETLTPQETQQMLAILNNPDNQHAARRLMQMLGDSTGAARSLLRMADTDLGRRFISMLNDPNEAFTAQQILESQLDARSQQELLDMLADPERRVAARHLLTMLSSDERRQARGAANLLSMLTDTNEATRRDGQQMVSMLSNSETRPNTMAMLSVLNSPEQYRRMLAIMNNPQQRLAASNLLRLMAGNENTQEAVADLFNMLTSGRRADAERVLAMLNDADRAPIAESILTQLENRQQREQMVSLLNTPGRETLAANIVAMLRSGNSNEQRNAASLLERMGGADAATRRQIEMLGRPDVDRSLFARLNSAQIDALMSILDEPARRQAAAQLQAMLNSGNAADLQGVRNLLDMMSTRGGQAGAQQLIDMLNNPARQAEARSILTGTQSTRQLERIAELLAAGGDIGPTLVRMLGNPEQRHMAQTLLDNLSNDRHLELMLGIINDPEARQARDVLLRMLGDETQAFAAVRFLSVLERNRAVGRQLLAILNNEESPLNETVHNVLQGGGIAAENVGRLLEILNSPEHREAAQHIMSLLQIDDFSNPAAVNTLLSLLNNEATRMEGERLLEMLGDSRRRYTAMRILDNRPSNDGFIR